MTQAQSIILGGSHTCWAVTHVFGGSQSPALGGAGVIFSHMVRELRVSLCCLCSLMVVVKVIFCQSPGRSYRCSALLMGVSCTKTQDCQCWNFEQRTKCWKNSMGKVSYVEGNGWMTFLIGTLQLLSPAVTFQKLPSI